LPQRAPVRLRAVRIERLLGQPIDAERVEAILLDLGMRIEPEAHGWLVTPPSFRFDISIEQDLIEEVARVYGYSRLPSTLPVGPMVMAGVPEARIPVSRMRRTLVERGYQEAITYSFVEPKLQSLLDPQRTPIALANPISADLAVMRTSLWPGLMQALTHNINRQQSRVRLFETGLRFVREGEEVQQERMVGGLAYGAVFPEQWGVGRRPVDFYDVKGDVEALLALTANAAAFSFEVGEHPALHPGQTARLVLEDETVGWLGALHPQVQQRLGIAGTVYLFELGIDAIQQACVPKAAALSKFPAIRRDIAIVVDRKVPAEEVLGCIRRVAPTSLRELKLFDVYVGERIDSGRKSLAVGLTLQEQSRTLTDDEVDAIVAGVLRALGDEFGATLRE